MLLTMLCLILRKVFKMAQTSDVYVSDHSEPVLRFHNLRTAANSAAYLLESILPDMPSL